MTRILAIILTGICALALPAGAIQKDDITEIKLNVYPAKARIEIHETAILHAEFFGQKKKGVLEKLLGSGESAKSKLQSNNWRIEVVTPNGGVLSKPFFYQAEGEKVKGGWQGLISQGLGVAASKDAVAFTAPARTGKYAVRLTEGSLKQEVTIEVVAPDPNIRRGSWFFSEKEDSPYMELVQRYAPFIAQETWFNPKADYLARFDYDDNWKGDDNWENLGAGSKQAFVYYAVMETPTHWFLHYNFFHPRDYSDVCVAGTCHENDYEGLILTIRKDGTEFGKAELMETFAHNNVYSFSNEKRIRKGVHNIDGGIDFFMETHPIVFIEAGGHGVYSASYKSSLFDVRKMDFAQNTGITYQFKDGLAQAPASGNDRGVGYGLLSVGKELWPKGIGDGAVSNETFEKFFVYAPVGGRPRASAAYIAGAFRGRTASNDSAKPFWAWHDNKTRGKKILSDGQWALDPAYSISVCLNFPDDFPVSTDYVYNPFLQGTP